MIRRFVSTLAVLCAASALGADALRPFVPGSLESIRARYEGKPFILAFWSIGCTHCPGELKALGELKRRQPGLNVVLVATDTPEDSADVINLAKGYGLGKVEQWVFADPMPERLRAEIDKRWYGELPRTHFYDRQHRVETVSGLVPQVRLEQWAKTNAK